MNEYTIDGVLKREFKGLDNKEYWRISKEIWKHVTDYTKQEIKFAKAEWEKDAEKKAKEQAEKQKSVKSVLLTPEERMDKLTELLDTKLINQELTAPEIRELKDLFNLKAKDQDILIQMTDYRAVNPEMAKVIEAVNWQIEEYNAVPANG